eukprot:4524209-Pyramimonas_sp.AAC.1
MRRGRLRSLGWGGRMGRARSLGFRCGPRVLLAIGVDPRILRESSNGVQRHASSARIQDAQLQFVGVDHELPE